MAQGNGRKLRRIESFDFQPQRILAGKYRVEAPLGAGWEGEVYRVVELKTGISRAAKVFYPQRNARDRAVHFYATKLDRLRKCSAVIQYHHSESIRYRGVPITCLISELVEGELLRQFVRRQPGRRLHTFEALHLLYALVVGVQEIHKVREYHGDIHDANILVMRHGIRFEVKLVDFYYWGPPTTSRMQDDVVDLIRILYDITGGARWYAKQSMEVKAICCGLRRNLILKKFPTANHLREYLDTFPWSRP